MLLCMPLTNKVSSSSSSSSCHILGKKLLNTYFELDDTESEGNLCELRTESIGQICYHTSLDGLQRHISMLVVSLV